MKQKIVVNIGRLAGILPAGKERLCGKEMAQMETLENAWMLIEDGRIKDFGGASEAPIAPKAPPTVPEGASLLFRAKTFVAPSGAERGASGASGASWAIISPTKRLSNCAAWRFVSLSSANTMRAFGFPSSQG